MAEYCSHGSGSSAVDVDRGAHSRNKALAADPVEPRSAGTEDTWIIGGWEEAASELALAADARLWMPKEQRKMQWGKEKMKGRSSPRSSAATDAGVGEAAAELAAAEKSRRRKEQEEAYNKAVRERKARKDEIRKVYAAQSTRMLLNSPKRRGCGYFNPFMSRRGRSRAASVGASSVAEDEEEETGLEPFFFDEAQALADHAAAEEKRKRKEQEEQEAARDEALLAQRWKAHMSALGAIRSYNHKLKCSTFTRFYLADLSTFDLDEESPLGPMRYADAAINVEATACCKEGEKRFLPCDSVNVLSVKVAFSKLGFPINVYGNILARDSLDLKCVYLFRRDRNHCQLLNSEDDLLLLTGPKRGLALIDAVYIEMDLKIKGDRGCKDKHLSKGFLSLDGARRSLWEKMKVESDSLYTSFGTVEVIFAAVKRAVEATIAIELIQGEFRGKITACTTSIQESLVLHDSSVADTKTCDGTGAVQLLRHVVAVSLKEKLEVTALIDGGKTKSTIEFTPRASTGDKDVITCGPIKMLVKVTWSIIKRRSLG